MNEMMAAPSSATTANLVQRRHGLLGTPGYTIPELAGARQVPFEVVARGEVSKLKLATGDFGPRNTVWLSEGAILERELILHTLPRTTGATVVIGRELQLTGNIHIMGSEQTVVLTGGRAEVGHSGRITAKIWGQRAVLFMGEKSSSNGCSFVLTGDDAHVIVGDDCMFASGIHISTHDEHAVMDIATRKRVNAPGSVLIEPHVWLGRDTTVCKKVRIGLGSVVGAHSLVTKSFPRFSVIGGAPAKLIRSGSTWDRWALGRAGTIDRVLALAEQVRLRDCDGVVDEESAADQGAGR